MDFKGHFPLGTNGSACFLPQLYHGGFVFTAVGEGDMFGLVLTALGSGWDAIILTALSRPCRCFLRE